MSRRSITLLKTVLSAMHYSGADSMMAPFTRGIGAILMLHHVSPEAPGTFEPHRVQKVSPDFLEQAIRQVRASGFDIVSLDEAHFRLVEGEYRKPFVCFTLDDGYRDNLEYAYPVFKRHQLPFAVYVPTSYPDGHGDLWWLALARVVVKVDALDAKIDGSTRRLRCSTPTEKDAAYHTIYWWLRSIDEEDARAYVRDLCYGIDFDPKSLCHELMMTWDEIGQLAADPLVTIGAHTRSHFALAKLTLAEARAEIADSVRRIERETGRTCQHFSYPYGDEASAGPREFQLVKEMGFKTGVTTRNSLIRQRHSAELTALPRVPLNGDYQKPRYVKVLLSGVPFVVGASSRALLVT
jgi:peptidoglycan/xylan/chitin deacetylase (PgdA/CDA1 family)